MTNETETTDLAIIDTPATMIASETELRSALVPIVRESLAVKGATARIGDQTHYTRQGLLTIAGHLNVSCDFSKGKQVKDPLTETAGFEVSCTATRMDGVRQQALGYASLGETRLSHDKCDWNGKIHQCEDVPRWEDWFAVRSMAQTRAQVRALNALLLPAIQQAASKEPDRRISTTPAEDMPPERPRVQAPPAQAAPAAPPAEDKKPDQPRALIEWAHRKWKLEGGASGVQQILAVLEADTWGDALGHEGIDGDWKKLAKRLQDAMQAREATAK